MEGGERADGNLPPFWPTKASFPLRVLCQVTKRKSKKMGVTQRGGGRGGRVTGREGNRSRRRLGEAGVMGDEEESSKSKGKAGVLYQ